jgi:hypothetical protein
MIISDALHAYANATQPVFSKDDRASTVGASEIGQCIRKIFWIKNEDDKRLAVPRDEGFVDSWGARRRGTAFEQHFWVPAMRKRFGKRLKFAGKSQRTFTKDYLSATPDALIINLNKHEREEIDIACGDCVTAECKTADPRTNLTDAKAENVYQTIVQLGLIRDTTHYQPTHALLSYTDASFWSEGKEFVIAFDEDIYNSAHWRATVIMTDTSLERIPPEGWIAGGHECKYCPFTKACGIERRNLPFTDDEKPLDKQFVAEVTDMAQVIKSAEGSRDACDALMRTTQDAMKNRLREKGVRKVPGVVSWTNVKGRESYDNKAIREAAAKAGVDVEQYQTVGEPTDRLTISVSP